MCPNEGKRDGAVNGRCLVHMVFTVVGNPLVSTGDGKGCVGGNFRYRMSSNCRT